MLKKLFLYFSLFFLLFGFVNIVNNFKCFENVSIIKNVDALNEFKDINFVIKVGDFTPGGQKLRLDGNNTKEKVNFLLGTIIQKLMKVLGAFSLLIMTIGGAYMIFYHGQDELLSKGKSIFVSGLIALLVALSSYYIVSLVRFILYYNN